MVKLTFLDLANKILIEEKRPLSPSDIWKVAVSKGYDKEIGTKGKTPDRTLYSRIFIDQRDNPNTIFVKIGSRPARYYLKTLPDATKPKQLEKKVSTEEPIQSIHTTIKERDLHQFLCYFAYQRLNAYCKTIRHNTSSKREFGEWVHPDMIGTYYPSHDYKQEVLDLSKEIGGIGVKLYSFEIKRQLSFLNLREAFFQAVSNSSWAHEGYLVAAEINTDEDFRGELRRLSTSFGIGIIHIDLEDPDSSDILIPAKEREALDWDALNKLTMNEDVRHLFVRIKNDLKINEIGKTFYDQVLGRETMLDNIGSQKT